MLLCPLFFIRQLPLAMLFLGVAGAAWAPYTPMETTLLQRLVPAGIRGQVFGALAAPSLMLKGHTGLLGQKTHLERFEESGFFAFRTRSWFAR